VPRHLLFDFGGPMLLTPFELAHHAAPTLGVDPSSLPGGPFDPNDERWAARDRGEITEREYWAERAAGFGLDIAGYMAPFYEPSGDHLVRPLSWALVDEVLADGRRVGLLTNDLTAFHDVEWQEPITVLKQFDPIIDLSVSGVLKPDPRAYAIAIDAMCVDPGQIVFTDDHHDNVSAGAEAGLVSIWFDVTDPAGSIDRVRSALDGASG
jgi:putative hydrolase of the HAD superfamily